MSDLSDDLQKMVSTMKTEIVWLKKSCRLIELYESEFFSVKINQLRALITGNLLPKYPNQAIDLLKSLLDLHREILKEVDDNNRFVGDVFMPICATLGQAYEAFATPLDEIAELVSNLVITSDFNICDIIFHFKNVLGNKGLKSIEQKLKQSYNSQNGSYGITALKIKSRLKQIADCQDDVIAYIWACSLKSLPSTQEHFEIAQRFIKHCKGQEAIEWLDSMDISNSNLWDKKRKKLKVQALEVCGYFEEAQAERLQLFEETLSTDVYKAIIIHSEVDNILSFIKVAIKRALYFPDPHAAITFLIDIKEFEHLAQLVLLKSDFLDGNKYEILHPAADILLELDPLAATLLYRKLIQTVLASADYKYYNFAAKDLVTCGILSAKITDWRQNQHHDTYISDLSIKQIQKKKFWAAYYSAVYEERAKWSESTKSQI